jgi:hypothetical protein
MRIDRDPEELSAIDRPYSLPQLSDSFLPFLVPNASGRSQAGETSSPALQITQASRRDGAVISEICY